MADRDPIMSDHSDTSEEEANELRRIDQDNSSDDTILGSIGNITGSLSRPLGGDRADDADQAVLNDREQR